MEPVAGICRLEAKEETKASVLAAGTMLVNEEELEEVAIRFTLLVEEGTEAPMVLKRLLPRKGGK